MRAKDPKATEKLYSESWLYSYPLGDLRFTFNRGSEAFTVYGLPERVGPPDRPLILRLS
jgi:hypothetical protein